jgi:hypothetical protein
VPDIRTALNLELQEGTVLPTELAKRPAYFWHFCIARRERLPSG